MASTLGKNLNLWFTKIKRPTSSQSTFPENHESPVTTSTTTNTTTLIKNFNSLYDHTLAYTTTTTTSNTVSSSESDAEAATIPDFATIFASERFFFSSPGQSNSIIDSSYNSSSSRNKPETDTLIGNTIAIPTYSPDPFVDFRRSMQEMVEARELIDVRENWDCLHQLLMSYLALNPKSTHKFIVGAFSDLLVSLITSSSSTNNAHRKSNFSDQASCKISRRSI